MVLMKNSKEAGELWPCALRRHAHTVIERTKCRRTSRERRHLHEDARVTILIDGWIEFLGHAVTVCDTGIFARRYSKGILFRENCRMCSFHCLVVKRETRSCIHAFICTKGVRSLSNLLEIVHKINNKSVTRSIKLLYNIII